jgi:hypothetical protein
LEAEADKPENYNSVGKALSELKDQTERSIAHLHTENAYIKASMTLQNDKIKREFTLNINNLYKKLNYLLITTAILLTIGIIYGFII